MPVLPTTAYSQAEDALTLARALVNDSSGAAFTATLLIPPPMRRDTRQRPWRRGRAGRGRSPWICWARRSRLSRI